jgi:hypothetical protein
LRQVLWIGGAPASGKTTIATALARRHGLRLYRADTRTWVHRDRAIAMGHEAARRWESMTPSERWETSSPAEMLAMSLHRERGAMVIDDLRALPDSPLIVAEGSPLPASAVSSGVADPSRAVWLLPTEEFQDAQLATRHTPDGPARLYRLLRETIAAEAHEHGAPTLVVDGSRDATQMTDLVERVLSGPIAAGPIASTLGARQDLLREANLDVVAQVRGYHARPWAGGDAETVRQVFVCECGDARCELAVELTVGAAAATPVHAPGCEHRVQP